MFEVERNSPIEAEVLAEFFGRCGWQESDASSKLEWALAAAEEWVVCKLDGQLVGFGRSCRLDPVKRIVFDVVVDPRFKDSGLKGEIVRLLTQTAGRLEEVSVFSERRVNSLVFGPTTGEETGSRLLPAVPSQVYLGRRSSTSPDEEG